MSIFISAYNNGFNLILFLKMSSMFKKNKGLSVLLVVFFLFFSLNFVLASDYGLKETVSQGKLKSAFSVTSVDSAPGNFISSRLGILIGAILSFIGVIFMGLIIFGGFQWMLARGNEQQVEKARDLIMQAIIGLVIVLSAYAITAFIGEQLTSTSPSSSFLNPEINFYC